MQPGARYTTCIRAVKRARVATWNAQKVQYPLKSTEIVRVRAKEDGNRGCSFAVLTSGAHAELHMALLQVLVLAPAYQRGDILEKRRQLMPAWTDYCEKGEPAAGNVVALRA
jgi:hypothetical protein